MRLIGTRDTTAGGAITELAHRCGRLPLALRIAAERAISRPELSLGDLVAELADEQHRLDVLNADERTGVRTVYSWSYRQLDAPAARMFRHVRRVGTLR